MAHGWANLFSACFGSLQTYMVYSCSVLYQHFGLKSLTLKAFKGL